MRVGGRALFVDSLNKAFLLIFFPFLSLALFPLQSSTYKTEQDLQDNNVRDERLDLCATRKFISTRVGEAQTVAAFFFWLFACFTAAVGVGV